MASKLISRVLPVAVSAISMLIAFDALAQAAGGTPRGRTLFEQKQCAQCHFYEARGIAPSVKTMRAALKGNPTKASEGIAAAPAHAADIKSIAPADTRAMAEWLAATTFEEQAAAIAAQPKPGSPEAKRLAAAKAKQEAEAKAKAAAEAKAQAKKDAEAKAKAAADAKIQAKKDAEAKAKQDAEARAKAESDAKAQAKAKQEKDDLAKREAEAKARKDTAALDAIKRETEERAKREAEAQAAAKRDAEARAKKEAEVQAAKREADEKARLEAEAKARKEAEAAKKPEPVATAKADPAGKADAPGPGGRKKLAYRDGSDLPPCPAPTGAPLGTVDENAAKSIIERVGCPQCHAYVQKKTGPPMKNIQEKYKGDWECVVSRLTKNKTHKEEGVTDDLKANEFKIVADYIATRAK